MKKIYAVIFLTVLFFTGFAQKDKYRIVYNVYYDTSNGNYEVFITDADGKNQKNLSNYAGLDWVYRTYKDKIYFISDRDTSCRRCYKLYEMDQQGNNVRKISDLVLEDSWMDTRNGKEMIVSARIGREVRVQLFMLNLENGSYKQLTHDTAGYYVDPLFLPESKQVVFRYRSDRRNRYMKTELYIMNEDGTGMRQLTYYPQDDTTNNSGEYHAGPPRWNDKGKFISYISFQKGKFEVYGITADGKKQWQITRGDKAAGWHDWTPDGKWMAVDISVPGKKVYDIYLMNARTKKMIPLANTWKYEQAPSFIEIKK
ncbi:MAG: PD40 domain-containing protein [Chitinophagaceae bacterium]|nr:PD40 domain-containing protein [Chitinophagaceae bacterium]